jgi:phospholipid N-methyltransferase
MQSLKFFLEFVRHPIQVGAVLPSSAGLCRALAEWIDYDSAKALAEFGPGTGAATPHILERLRPETRFFAIERSPDFATIFRERFPDVTLYEDSAVNVAAICGKEGIDQLDAVLCGLPWASFPESLQNELLDAIRKVLRPGGQFVTFAYLQGVPLPAGQRFRKKLREYFSEVGRSPVVWRNVPPAFIYRCRR